MLSMTEMLRASDIESIRQLKMGKVYGLSGFQNDRIVLKLEATSTEQTFKEQGKVIKLFDPTSKAKALTPTERLELKQYCDRIVETETFYKSLGNGYNESDHAKACKYISEDLGNPKNPTFLKMGFQNVIDLETATEAYSKKGDKGPLKQLFGALNASGGLERLGNMIAADAFNGNMDRVFWEGPDFHRKLGTFDFRFKAILNPGNIMVSLGTESNTVAMLDYVDPGSQFRDLNVSLAKCEQLQRVKWPVKHLLTRKDRLAFANKLVDDLESISNPGKRFFSMGKKLGKGAAERIAFGIYEGLSEIAISVRKRTLTKQCPIGLTERLAEMKGLI